MTDVHADPQAAAREAAAALAEATGVPRHDVAVILGSGWGPAADALGTTVAEIDAHTLPGFRPPVADGHQPPLVRRVTAARLPHAELAFLDEVFRGGSHILNTLLTIINEKKYDSGE